MVDLLGRVALGELLAFERMAADAHLALDLPRRPALSEIAAAGIGNYRRPGDRLTALGVRPDDAMAPYVEPLQAYRDLTVPHDCAEAVTKAYVGDAVTRGALTALIAQGEQVDVAGLIRRLTDSHTARMAAAGLNN
ncbi:ferritin-like fold-containing protein [Micromonospora fiedleri]|uniref:ferritin-like fold-containing protein n=1 Tax=Micromonospora fiedleri TaxID=1157498 RepID=UPI0027DDDD13|nr:ferritin-like fold-containing protein [Micromonospora fiedleri]